MHTAAKEHGGWKLKLKEIRKLIEAATPGPWSVIPLANATYHLDDGAVQPRTCADANFIAASRALMPKLLAVADLARGMLKTQYVPEIIYPELEKALATPEAEP